jgi:hypothetical protein
MPSLDAIDDAGPLPLFALDELHDYLHIFQETARSGLLVRIEDDHLTITFDGNPRGDWCRDGDSLVFHGEPFAQVRSLQAAVLHTLNVIAQHQ